MEPARGSAAITVTARFRNWLAGWGFKEWRRAGLVAVLVATAAFGGLDTVDKNVTDLKPGQEFNTGRFTMTVQRATLLDEVRAGRRVVFRQQPGRSFLGLVVKARNDGTLPGAVDQPIELIGVRDAKPLSTMRFADGTSTVRLGPGLADELVLLWDIPDGAVRVGDDLPIRIWNEVRKINATVGQAWVLSLTKYGQMTIQVGGRT